MPVNTSSRVLFIIPTLGDRLDLLEETLQSVAIQVPKPDIVMVCPVKSVQARILAGKFGAKTVDDPKGLSAAINAGLASAEPRHEFIAWMGDDDLLREGSLKNSIDLFDSNSTAVAVFGPCDYIDDKSNLIFTNRSSALAPWIMSWGPNLVPLPGSMLRLSAVREVGGYDESLKYAMDLDIFLKLRRKGPFIYCPQTLAAFRWHPDSTTVANRTASLNEAEMVKRRQLPKYIRPFSRLWEGPVRLATHIAAKRVNALAKKR